VAIQIAAGMEAAHDQGVIHRDLKPANIVVTPEGRVKVLDFGLAKSLTGDADGMNLTHSPTVTSVGSVAGAILGTASYMSPEQARGQTLDQRTDVWAFGCVLYECLTGKRAFVGESLTDVLASIVGEEPDWTRLPAVPARVRELLRRTLTKDPRGRLRDAGEARVQLLLATSEPAETWTDERVGPAGSWPLRNVALAASFSVAALLAGLWIGSGHPADPSSETVSIKPSFHGMLHEFGADESPDQVTISPDGTRVAWSDRKGLHVRALGGELAPRTILRSWELRRAFAWSPDGLEIAFHDEGALWRIPAAGGTPIRFADFDGFVWTWLEWSDDGRIAYNVQEGIAAVSEGDERTILVEIDRAEVAHLHGFVLLPGGEGVLAVPHFAGGGKETVQLFRNAERKELLFTAGTEPGLMQVTPDGSLFWQEERQGLVWRVPLSLDKLEQRRESQLVAEDCYLPSLSIDGALAYLTREGEVSYELGWIDRNDGSFTPLGQRHALEIGRGLLSTDGRQIVFTTNQESSSETWVHDLERGLSTVRIKRDDGSASSLFFPDGRIGVTPHTTWVGTFVYSPSGKGEPESFPRLWGVSPDPAVFITRRWSVPGTSAYYLSGPGVEGGERLLLSGEHGERFHRLSNDGAWMLYSSKRTGARQVLLTRVPGTEEEEWRVSAEGGEAAWFGDENDEILFVNEHVVYRVALETAPVVRLGAPERLFDLPTNIVLTDYDGSSRLLGVRNSTGKSWLYVDTDWTK
jgi:serine/threonine-protein kinase